MADQWYVAPDGQTTGPFGLDELKAMLASGRINNETLVFGPGAAEWTPLRSVGSLASLLQGGGPPPPPPGQALGADEIDYVIEGSEMQYVEIELDPGESAVAEAGAMFYMTQGIAMETIFGDGRREQKTRGLMDNLIGAGKRLLTGESLFMTIFTNSSGAGKQRVAFGAPYPGKILPLHLGELGGEIVCQKDAFLCAARGVALEIAFQKKIGVGLFGGEGFIMQRLKGDGLAFVHAGGTLVELDLAPGETLKVDTGCLVALKPSVNYDVEFVGGVKTALFGGEGLFFATLSGPGHVWLQSLPLSRLAGRIYAAAPQGGGKDKGEGSLLGKVGIGTFFGDD
ncbi:hypothetical protein AAU61_20900 [Desulfocarbo indianensis]|nr:hypothetical protein AAU61_20900 [Desulfocarbo indianensis]